MATTEEIINKIGSHLLFLGIETFSWSTQQFMNCALFCYQHKVDSVIIKTGEASAPLWYGGLNGFDNIKAIFNAHGVGCVPYFYLDGGVYFNAEVANVKAYMTKYGVCIVDIEIEWAGLVNQAIALREALKPVPGILIVSTFADPELQNFNGIIEALAPATDCFMPQAYNSWLGNDHATFDRLVAGTGASIQPTVNLDNSFGANNPVAIAQSAYNRGARILSIWEYVPALNNPSLFDAVLSAFPKTPVASPKPTQAPTTTPVTTKPPVAHPVSPTVHPQPIVTTTASENAAAIQEWEALYKQRGQVPPPHDDPIFASWQYWFERGKFFGPVVISDTASETWGGKPLDKVWCLYARGEYNSQTKVTTWYYANGEIK